MPTSEFNSDPALTQAPASLMLTTPSGLTGGSGVGRACCKAGSWRGSITLRDKTLVEAQAQLDEIAAGLAQAFSTVHDAGRGRSLAGFSTPICLAWLPGNDDDA
jgi:flagellar hook-associated protein 1 FlgK